MNAGGRFSTCCRNFTVARGNRPRLYVACGGDGTITPVAVATGRPLRPIRVAAAWTGDPEALAVSPNGQTLYAANQVTGTVVTIPAPRQ